MKRVTAALIAVCFMLAALSGCGAQPDTGSDEQIIPDNQEISPDNQQNVTYKKISVVATMFPQYDWVREIIGDNADNFDLTLLLDSRVDLHSYQPTVDDIIKIAACDLFIYIGGVSDEWVDDVLRGAANPDMIVLNLMDVLGDGVKAEEIIEGMEHSHINDNNNNHDHDDHDDDHDDGHDDSHDDYDNHEHEYDEHIWLSLRNAVPLCSAIADALASLDADNAGDFRGNLAAYTEKLSALDAQYQAEISAAPGNTLLFADRFPFRYLADDYGISYYAAFSGCSAETEASFSTIVFLAAKVDELELGKVMVTESSDQSIARTVISSAAGEQEILVLDSVQSVTSNDVRNGAAYLSIMESNLGVLKEALG
ncbi:MAG: metal ABC transporter substrate-binding protein [Oscillospiraceae bacterium]|nr:metal ABC transporter substrate-binding protein [Oscillospiraceae bacterium]